MAPRNRPWLGRPWPGQQCEAAELIRACRCAAPEVASLGAEGATACVPPARQPPTLCVASLPPERCGCRSRWPSGARLSSSEVPREGSAGDGGGFGEPVLPFGLEGGILLGGNGGIAARCWESGSVVLDAVTGKQQLKRGDVAAGLPAQQRFRFLVEVLPGRRDSCVDSASLGSCEGRWHLSGVGPAAARCSQG